MGGGGKTETEVKYHVNENDLPRLKRHLVGARGMRVAKVLRQTSYFFDVTSNALDTDGTSFRLRRVEHIDPATITPEGTGMGGGDPRVTKDTWEITVKGKGRVIAGGWCKPEEEIEISVAEGLRLLENPGTPGARGSMFAAFPEPRPDLVVSSEALCVKAGGALKLMDQFVNLRCKMGPFAVPVPGGGDSAAEETYLEVDRTTFHHAGHSMSDAEIECELSSADLAPAAGAALARIVQGTCGYAPWAAVGKRKRCQEFKREAMVRARM